MITATGEVTFTPLQTILLAEKEMARRVGTAALVLQHELRETVKVPGNALNKAAVGKDGVIRSRPGEPPRKQSGFGQRSIAIRLRAKGKAADIGIFANAGYMAILEVGTRDGRILARPWLRPTLDRQRSRLAAILAGAGGTGGSGGSGGGVR